jgi:hypothetical protein
MDILKKFFPFSFGVKTKEINSLIAGILIYVVIGIVIGVLAALLGNIPVLGVLMGITAGLAETYCTGGIVLSVLKFVNVLK